MWMWMRTCQHLGISASRLLGAKAKECPKNWSSRRDVTPVSKNCRRNRSQRRLKKGEKQNSTNELKALTSSSEWGAIELRARARKASQLKQKPEEGSKK